MESPFQEYAQIQIDTTKLISGIELQFDEASIRALDEIITNNWPDEPPKTLENMVALFGSFLGETIRKTIGGAWVEGRQGWCMKIGDAEINVFTKVKKRFLNGMEDSLFYYYQMIKKMAANDFKDITSSSAPKQDCT